MYKTQLLRCLILGSFFVISGAMLARSASAQSSLDPGLAFAAVSDSQVKLDKNASIGGATGALGDLILGESASVSGNGTSLGNKIKLSRLAVVSGICETTGGKVTLGKNATCTGGVDTAGINPAIVPLQTFSTSGAKACPPGGVSEGALTLDRNGAATLTAVSGFNEFDYTNITLKKNAFLTVSGPADALVVIKDSGSLTLDKGAAIAVGSGGLTPSNLLILVNTAKSSANSIVSGSLVSAGVCNLKGNSFINGQLVCGGKVTLGAKGNVSGGKLNEQVATDVTCP
ncbi:MAG TPA: hypothetical protein VKS22_09515 [Candidatus Binataceae bacterium]|nr:hypothetical protein [Candidatus Binataceae bacterium]